MEPREEKWGNQQSQWEPSVTQNMKACKNTFTTSEPHLLLIANVFNNDRCWQMQSFPECTVPQMATSWQNIKWTLTALQLRATHMLMDFCIRIRWNVFVLNTNAFNFHHIWYKKLAILHFQAFCNSIFFSKRHVNSFVFRLCKSEFSIFQCLRKFSAVRFVVNQITTSLTRPPLAVNSAVQCRKVWYQLFTLGQRGTSGGLLLKCHSDTNLYIYTMLRGAGASQ